jgi:hypothetical protein
MRPTRAVRKIRIGLLACSGKAVKYDRPTGDPVHIENALTLDQIGNSFSTRWPCQKHQRYRNDRDNEHQLEIIDIGNDLRLPRDFLVEQCGSVRGPGSPELEDSIRLESVIKRVDRLSNECVN